MKCLGLMSGTSMDGVDCAIVDVRPGRSTLRTTLLAHRTHPYPPALREQILSLLRSSLQIGDPSVIAERTGILTVAD